ncbi:L-lactate dehydrogenase [Spirochaeta africana]|uniref:L-lactate dehydrogenase n=1 Tax=Spirochaeta africana (strain ATCC 700263 / DSM 8902 / Z-7692) TaxID=889378 RepID=H9ULD2_SPIAZ|nr:L-lactate dehydrogenase [Spirochaeta africana]AFG38325.1 L-lactate dehydrogenase [Spirochaeta africana DSM 8902]
MIKNKIAIIGAGSVGATIAYNLSNRGLANEMVLVDVNREKAEAEVLDITHGMPLGSTANIYAAGYEACGDAEIAIITAGAKQRPDESRVQLMDRNVGIMRSMVGDLMASGFGGVILVVTNPVDVLTFVAYRESGLPAHQVIGSGTVIDSARLRTFLSRSCSINPQNVHGYVIGEHGDTSFPAWSNVTFGGVGVQEFCQDCDAGCGDDELRRQATEYVRQAAQTIIKAKGSTYYAVAQAVAIITQAVLRDERRILPITAVMSGFEDFREVAFSYPHFVGKNGIATDAGINGRLRYELTAEEQEQLRTSIRYIIGNTEQAGY